MQPERIEPSEGKESVWDYPRPPRLEPSTDRVVVSCGDVVVADSIRTARVLETSQPPAYYIPPADVSFEHLVASPRRSMCEWKGEATYFDLELPDRRIAEVAWTYPDPPESFAAIADHVAFYAQRLTCRVNDEVVVANDGSFYGGWITSNIVGPFKGAPGTGWW